MPTKRMFDLVVITGLLMQPVKGLFKMWASRKVQDENSGDLSRVVAGAVRVVS